MTQPPPGDRSGVAPRIKAARESLNISARELDRRANLREGHTSIIESRDRDIETETAAKIATALGVSLDWLITGTGDGPLPHTRTGPDELAPVVVDKEAV